jgi:hypothetical protein
MKMLDWSGANCEGINTELFFPDKNDRDNYEFLKRICNSCQIKQKCFEYAIQHNVDGYWAGTTATTRKRMQRDFGIVPKSYDDTFRTMFYSSTDGAIYKRKQRQNNREAS